jgi:Gpi18-like mannosyltransferase
MPKRDDLGLDEGKAAVKLTLGKREAVILAALLIFAFLIRLALFLVPGCKNDLGINAYWFNTAASHGPRVFYNLMPDWTDYPPFNVYIFWLFGSLSNAISSLLGTDIIMYIIKLPANLFDMATAFLIFFFVRKHLTFNKALMATAFYAFNPAVVFDAAIWGQLDAIYTFFLVLSLFLMFDSKPKWAAVSFMIGVLTKPQSIALAPLLIFLTFRKYSWRGLFTSVLVAVLTVFAVIIPFEWSNPVTFLSKIYFAAYGHYGYVTLNAFNVWSFVGMKVSDAGSWFLASYNMIGWAMFGVLSAFTLYFVYKRFSMSDKLPVIFAAFVFFFGFFMLPTRMHERYLFPAISMLALMFPFLKKTRPVFAVLTATYLINLAYVLYWLNLYADAGYTYGPNLTGDPVALTISLINLAALLYVLMLMLGELMGRKWLRSDRIETQPTLQEKEDG